uniref:Trehalase n=1 Tax=Physcomitrium patens TaxID=3218 RepID=A0A7I4FFM8_PHYPA
MSVDDEERLNSGAVVKKVNREGVTGRGIIVEVVEDWREDDDYEDGVYDDGAGELLCFLMDLQAAAMGSFGGGPEFDPKLYVDLPLTTSLEETEAAFGSLPRCPTSGSVEKDTLKAFLKVYFSEAGSDLIPYTPVDHLDNPPDFLPGVRNADARDWGLKVHSLWPSLTRLVSPAVEREPDQHTLLPLKYPFLVPGERFREVYYWDSYWVIRGLLASKMTETAAGMVDNFLSIVQAYGFFPNGTRTYYENRSQPPFLSRMVRAIFSETGDLGLVARALPILKVEYEFWTTDSHAVSIRDGQGRVHRLSRYIAHWDQPRPECSTIDKSIAGGFSKFKQQQIYRDIATAAESGWDFSSRWMEDSEQLSSLKTSSIVPVDLNAFLLQMELDIAFLAKTLNETQDAKRFTRAADARRRAFEAILWNENRCQWLDYWLPSQKSVQGGKVLSLVKSILAFGLFELTTLISCYSSMYCSTSTCGTAADLTETHMRQILCLCGAACFLQETQKLIK